MAGLSGSVPYGVAGSVSVIAAGVECVVAVGTGAGWVAALAIGASVIAAPIAAAANHGAASVRIFISISYVRADESERHVDLAVGGVGLVVV